jgi:methyl-accepting chemotaxis protein
MPSFKPFLITFCSGIAAILAWQSYGDAAKQIIASAYPHLGWLAPRATPIAYSAHDTIGLAAQAAASPDQQPLNAISLDLDAMRQNVDRIATTQEQITHSVDRIAITQEQITHSVDRLTAGQEQMTREITKLQAIEQQILHKNSEPAPRPAPASARKTPRSAQAHG